MPVKTGAKHACTHIFTTRKTTFDILPLTVTFAEIWALPAYQNWHRFRHRIKTINSKNSDKMFWTLELASYLEDAPWPATKDELIDYSIRSGAPIEVVENLQELEDEGEVYESIEDIWPDYPSQEDFMFNEDEY